ncbi:hypothetical protein QYF61_021561 [Mycteria americana]|uniref:Uncharacterized protein n=1 Tax=Mycteria americana TaxID=33587 RepID=A0AAN7SAZ5_MYCAM|nr:hypothetical protein QYF61_021561 [Mycteria americana]
MDFMNRNQSPQELPFQMREYPKATTSPAQVVFIEYIVFRAQDMVGFLDCKCILPAHVQFFIHQYPQVLLRRAALKPFIFQSVLLLGIALIQVQNLALGFVELHAVCTGPLLKPVKVPLDGIPSLQRIDCTTQLGVIHKLAEAALGPTVYIIGEDIKQYWSQYEPLRDTTCYWFPLGH